MTEKFKKVFFNLGSALMVASPVAMVVACGESDQQVLEDIIKGFPAEINIDLTGVLDGSGKITQTEYDDFESDIIIKAIEEIKKFPAYEVLSDDEKEIVDSLIKKENYVFEKIHKEDHIHAHFEMDNVKYSFEIHVTGK